MWTHSLDAALRHAREQRTLDPDAKPFWDYVVDYVGFLKATEGKVAKRKNPPRDDYGALARDLQGAVTTARELQTRFIKSRGMTWEQVRAMPKSERPAFQADYQEWLKNEYRRKKNPPRFEKGDRVVLRPDRAEAYGEPRERVYTVLSTKPHKKYKRTWVYLVELSAPNNVVDSRELRLASRRKNPRAKAMVPWYVEAGRPGKMGGRTSQSLYSYKLAEELAKRWSVQYGVATIRRADNEDTIVGQAVDGKITAGPRLKENLPRKYLWTVVEIGPDREIELEWFQCVQDARRMLAEMKRLHPRFDFYVRKAPTSVAKQNPVRRGGRGRFVHVRKVSPKRFVRSSLRTVKTNGGRVIVGHKKGERRRTTAGRTRLSVQAVLTPKGRGRTVQRRRNPVLGILGNPPGGDAAHLGKVTYVEYTHGADGKKYFHDFKPPVNATVLKDGRVVLWHPTHRLWKAF